jgi:hypothetical protein
VDGELTYSALVENEGSGIVFRFPADEPRQRTRLDVRSTERVGAVSYDGHGGFRSVDEAGEDVASEGVAAAGILANYRLPLDRRKLRLYVAPNSVAVYQDSETMRIAGVTYDGELAVYRQGPDGLFEEDVSFPPIPVADSNCLSAVSFGGDGRSLLLRHIEGAIQYIAAVGNGSSIGWRAPTGDESGEDPVGLVEAAPATDCDLPDTSQDAAVEKIAPVDETGARFALLDRRGVVWWVDVVEQAGGEGADGTPVRAAREFAPLTRAASGVTWIAGDPERRRAAMVSAAVVDIVPSGLSLSAEAKDGRGDTSPAETVIGVEGREGVAVGAEVARAQRLPRRGEPKAATFDAEGNIAVAYAGGQLFVFHEADGAWSVKFEGPITKSPVTALFATADQVAVADDRDLMIAIDGASGALSSYARIPANPSVLALGRDGTILSIEYDTDSVARLNFEDMPAHGEVVETARLVAMRSLRDI